MDDIDRLRDIADKCVRCGLCQSVCPVFAELQKETAVARGKVNLIRKIFSGEVRYSEKLSAHLLQCLGCGACTESCPNGVQADELILAARALMVEKKGLSFPKWLMLRKILGTPSLLPLLLKTGSLLQGLLFKKIPKESGLHLRFSLPYLDRRRLIPSIKNPFFLDRFAKDAEEVPGEKKIGLFVGCSINYLFPEVGESTLRLLKRSRFSTEFPKNQGCCGLPAYGSGDLETARSLARRNIEAFRKLAVDRILVPCASCFYFLKEGYVKLFPGEESVRTFAEKIVEPSTFFLDTIGPMLREMRAQRQASPWRVTYHDPCHLRRGMKIYEEPRQLLTLMPNVDFVEMKQPNRCCGMAGSFNFVYYDLSRKIVGRKLDDIERTKADAVVTSCMGCLIQLKDGIHGRGMETKTIHLVEALEKSLDVEKGDNPG